MKRLLKENDNGKMFEIIRNAQRDRLMTSFFHFYLTTHDWQTPDVDLYNWIFLPISEC